MRELRGCGIYIYIYIYIYTHIHIHNGILLSHKKNEILPFATTWMDLETVIQSEVSQKKKNEFRILRHICGI